MLEMTISYLWLENTWVQIRDAEIGVTEVGNGLLRFEFLADTEFYYSDARKTKFCADQVGGKVRANDNNRGDVPKGTVLYSHVNFVKIMR